MGRGGRRREREEGGEGMKVGVEGPLSWILDSPMLKTSGQITFVYFCCHNTTQHAMCRSNCQNLQLGSGTLTIILASHTRVQNLINQH